MLPTNLLQPAQNLVNYSILPTQASNEEYVAETDVPDSTAFLIKNNVFVELHMPATTPENSEDKEV